MLVITNLNFCFSLHLLIGCGISGCTGSEFNISATRLVIAHQQFGRVHRGRWSIDLTNSLYSHQIIFDA